MEEWEGVAAAAVVAEMIGLAVAAAVGAAVVMEVAVVE